MVGVLIVNETRRLLAANCFLELATEESVADIELVNWPVVRSREGEHRANGGRLDDGGETFVEIDAR
jgi:hypothetical protein